LEQDDEVDEWDKEAEIPYEETTNEDGIGNRIALNKMDWDNVEAVDLLALFRSLCNGDKIVRSVEIYPSLFGLQKMKEDAINGPPKEIFENEEVVKAK
jgi:hypothetical protein